MSILFDGGVSDCGDDDTIRGDELGFEGTRGIGVVDGSNPLKGL